MCVVDTVLDSAFSNFRLRVSIGSALAKLGNLLSMVSAFSNFCCRASMGSAFSNVGDLRPMEATPGRVYLYIYIYMCVIDFHWLNMLALSLQALMRTEGSGPSRSL